MSVAGGTVSLSKVGFERVSLGSLVKIGVAVHLPIWTLFYAFVLLVTLNGGGDDGQIEPSVVIVMLCAIPVSAIIGAAVFVCGALIARQIGFLRRLATVEPAR